MNLPWSHLHQHSNTLLIGGPEVVLDGLNHIGFDILLLLQSDRSSIHQLPVFVISEAWGRCFSCGFLDLGWEVGEHCESFNDVSQHDWLTIIKTNISVRAFYLIKNISLRRALPQESRLSESAQGEDSWRQLRHLRSCALDWSWRSAPEVEKGWSLRVCPYFLR